MRQARIFLVGLVALVLVGCSSTPKGKLYQVGDVLDSLIVKAAENCERGTLNQPTCATISVGADQAVDAWKVSRTFLDEGYRATHPWVDAGEYICLTCTDTGTGMDEETKERVFEPFFTTKPPGEGTGLGMAMIYGLVKQHGGYVHVYSEPGEGTTVNVYFPAVAARPEASGAAGLAAAEMRGRETVLLVEDRLVLRPQLPGFLLPQGTGSTSRHRKCAPERYAPSGG